MTAKETTSLGTSYSSTTPPPQLFYASALNRPMSFQQTTSSSSNFIPLPPYSATTTNHNNSNNSSVASRVSEARMLQPGNSALLGGSGGACSGGVVQARVGGGCSGNLSSSGGASASVLFDSVSSGALKQDAGSAVEFEWTVEEQYKLEEGLVKFAVEPSIMRYIKIAAILPDKTVRDVALRCRWMTRKRRKGEEFNTGKKVNNRKDKLPESSLEMNLPSVMAQNMDAYPLMMQYLDHGDYFPCEGISGTTRHLLEQNFQAFSHITSNFSAYKLQDNIDLFCRARNNITAILNDMRGMPGFMSQMPPLRVSINEDLANSILPVITSESMVFGSPRGIQLKQEPRF